MYYSRLSWPGWWRNTPLLYYTYFGQIGKDIWCHVLVCVPRRERLKIAVLEYHVPHPMWPILSWHCITLELKLDPTYCSCQGVKFWVPIITLRIPHLWKLCLRQRVGGVYIRETESHLQASRADHYRGICVTPFCIFGQKLYCAISTPNKNLMKKFTWILSCIFSISTRITE